MKEFKIIKEVNSDNNKRFVVYRKYFLLGWRCIFEGTLIDGGDLDSYSNCLGKAREVINNFNGCKLIKE